MLLRLSNLFCGLMITMGLVLQPSSASGGFVNIMAGYDLLYTVSSSFDFGGAGGLGLTPFVGVPLNTYNFGGGSKNVGATDTILHRLDPVTNLADGASQTINLAMVALSLQSQNKINWSGFGGIANEYVKTVNLVDDGSKMTITNSSADKAPLLEDGTFVSNLKFSFQLQGLDSGVLSPLFSLNILQTTPATWRHIPSTNNPNPVLIDGVNNHLNGSDHLNDFFTGEAEHGGGPPHHKTIDIDAVPEPTSLFAIGLACMAAGGRFARKRRLQQAT